MRQLQKYLVVGTSCSRVMLVKGKCNATGRCVSDALLGINEPGLEIVCLEKCCVGRHAQLSRLFILIISPVIIGLSSP